MRTSFVLLACACAQLVMAADPIPSWQDMQQAVLFHPDRAAVEKYLRAGFDPQSPIGCGTFNALDGAVENQDVEMVRLLLRYGARAKESTFVSAASRPSPETAVRIVSAFLQAGANVNSKMYFDRSQTKYFTALHWAVLRENVPLVRLLLAQKGISVNDVDGDGHTALETARNKHNPEIAALLAQAGANADATVASN